MRQELTQKLFSFITQYAEEHGFGPSVKEIAESCEVGEATVVRHLDRMQILGWITREFGKARSIRVVKKLEES